MSTSGLYVRSMNRLRAAGFTLIELLVVVALVAVLMSLAAPAMQNVRINLAISDAASNLYISVQQSQQSALKFNRTVVVAPVIAGDWRSGWRVFVKRDSDNLYNDGVDTQLSFQQALPSYVTVADTSGCERILMAGSGFGPDSFDNCRVVFGSDVTKRFKHVIVQRSGLTRICTSEAKAVASCPD